MKKAPSTLLRASKRKMTKKNKNFILAGPVIRHNAKIGDVGFSVSIAVDGRGNIGALKPEYQDRKVDKIYSVVFVEVRAQRFFQISAARKFKRNPRDIDKALRKYSRGKRAKRRTFSSRALGIQTENISPRGKPRQPDNKSFILPHEESGGNPGILQQNNLSSGFRLPAKIHLGQGRRGAARSAAPRWSRAWRGRGRGISKVQKPGSVNKVGI